MKEMLVLFAENIARRLIEWAGRQQPIEPSILEARKRLTEAPYP